MQIKKEYVILPLVVLVYSCWFTAIAILYTDGDVISYAYFYDLVRDEMHYAVNRSIWDRFLDILGLQRIWLNSREFLYTWIVMFFSVHFEYRQYQIISIILYVGGLVIFLRKVLLWPWLYVHASLLSSYALVIAIPAERLRWGVILFCWSAFVLAWWSERLATKAQDGRDFLWPGAVSAFAHIQMSGTAFAAHFALKGNDMSRLAMGGVLLVIVGVILIDQIQVKIIAREAQEGAMTSAILGIAMLAAISVLSQAKSVKLVAATMLAIGLIFGFSRLNLSVWLFFIMTLDIRDWKARVVYLLLTGFLGVRMIQMSINIMESGSAF
jgi:hypothetical protein